MKKIHAEILDCVKSLVRATDEPCLVRQANWGNVAGESPAGRKGNAATFPPESWAVTREGNG